ncbi:bifunctional UDP-N-acetylglucosamine diphosphorylase/glucosamine-1-phosphate N-acetyltransferase GlmU [Spongiibacter marinus]|uniref:bifunctional UDP-N-acetylglucosamine diphosphorylase/glucosamine-1-phosphate N-acetyltransferase GlmU n=1 Tax=Spongiibacter marinus TaxID=354246 RepID=UPI001961A73A|nr:bifunctional UDP-N-acetylglucosamine diphosphorylase/glucosamine-1-phosphate N-acetyltransferase GlmU [uncultured Spongiibacter sp.]MBM7422144.1 bifunctional UDP-N-acetylglucosamine pyrophosphorylase/glucosamine-1-phosphate N-acetyltransferase [Spongiibacter marinus]
MSLEVIILAAGQGTRMRSALPKVLHPLAGKPMLQHAIDAAAQTDPAAIHVVVGHGAEQVKAGVSHPNLQWALQAEQKGTGHAVAQGLAAVAEDATVLITYGDVPLVRPETLQAMVARCRDTLVLLTATLDDPTGYGRIIRNTDGAVQAIVEQKDASPEQLAVREVNTGMMALPAKYLREWLPALSADNAQGEYYLTDIIAMAVAAGVAVDVAQPEALWEVEGVNNRLQLNALERQYQRLIAEQLMTDGATLADAQRIDVRGTLSIGQDVSIDVNCVFEGEVELGDGVEIGPNCVISNSRVAAGTVIKANSVLEDAVVGQQCTIGPFARLRPGTVLADAARIGNFVETKNAQVGEGSKINHLSYVGDASLGAGVNIGAGTITCNYDGVNKSRTEIGDGAFVGSNTALVAPVSVGEGATVAAGSTITGNVADGELGVARGRQRNIKGWKRPVKTS